MDAPDNISAEEEALYNLSDEDLEAAFKEARDTTEDEVIEDEITEEEEVVEKDDEIEDNDDIVKEEEVEEDELEDLEDAAEEEEVEDLEQPDNKDSEEIEETEDEKTETLDEEDAVEESNKEEDQKFKIKADGTEFEFDIEELKQLAPKAMNYTKKMQELKPWRKTISALKDNDINHDDINLMIDVLKGDKDAIATVIKKSGVDTLELDTGEEVKYAPKEYGKSEQELDIQEIEDRISKDQEYNITTHVVNKQWDDNSREAMFDNPSMIEGLHADIKSGVFDKVSPMAMKLKVLDGSQKSDIEYYIEAGTTYYQQEEANQVTAEQNSVKEQEETQAKLLQEREAVKQVKEREVKQKTVKKAAVQRKAAATTKKAAGTRNVIDYLDDSDEAYDKWYDKLQASM